MNVNEINSKVVVAIRDLYNDNDGAYHMAYFLSDDKSELIWTQYSNGYNGVPFDAVKVNASDEDIELARNLYVKSNHSISDNTNLIGCTVKLAKSKKAPNNTELLVIEYHGPYVDSFNHHIMPKIDVQLGDEKYLKISESCVIEVVNGAKPGFF